MVQGKKEGKGTAALHGLSIGKSGAGGYENSRGWENGGWCGREDQHPRWAFSASEDRNIWPGRHTFRSDTLLYWPFASSHLRFYSQLGVNKWLIYSIDPRSSTKMWHLTRIPNNFKLIVFTLGCHTGSIRLKLIRRVDNFWGIFLEFSPFFSVKTDQSIASGQIDPVCQCSGKIVAFSQRWR